MGKIGLFRVCVASHKASWGSRLTGNVGNTFLLISCPTFVTPFGGHSQTRSETVTFYEVGSTNYAPFGEPWALC